MAYEFHHTNLRGTDFRGKNLTGANFSDADIRGADFSNAILIGANFSNAKAGLLTSRTIIFILLLLIFSLLAGLLAGYAGAYIGDLLSNSSSGNNLFGIIVLITLLAFFIVVIAYGLNATLAILITLVAASLVIALALFPENKTGRDLVAGAVFSILALAGTITGFGNMAVAVAVARVMTLHAPRTFTTLMALIGVTLGVVFGVTTEINNTEFSLIALLVALVVASLVGLVTIILGIYIGWLAIAGNQKYSIIKDLAVGIVASGGTKFCSANLTDANFTQATLKTVDFRQANLTRSCWFHAEHLHNARLEGTYLQDPKVRQLLITKDGRDVNFDFLNLRGLNLNDANLQDASFIGTDLSESTLENTNLSGAKLAQSHLYQANLNNACLTGAYIQNWGISTDTQLENVECEYIYMQLPTREDPDPCRKPDNRQETFKPGDFTDFIAPIIKTLDLYKTQNADPRHVGSKFKSLDLLHYEGIDPTAAAIAIIQLAEQNPDAEVQIVALEGRGEEKIRLQAIVAGDANPSELNREYFEKYREIQSLPYSDLQTLMVGIKEKDERIRSLENLLENAIHQRKFYVETTQSQALPANSIKIMFLASDPTDAARLRLGQELRDIKQRLKLAKQRERFVLQQQMSVRSSDISQALLEFEPMIVHFSGHGTNNGELWFENEVGKIQPVKPEALANLFALVSQQVKCVVLNACYSETQAKSIAEHIQFVIGMNQAIGDEAAIAFAVGFYTAIGANRPIPEAYQFGCTQIQLEGIPENLTPVLYQKK
ncbi:MAG: pentapeptide repeat-containing protein [Calothrix sp. MO_192.B10]|nr:pentapeptide repeat-containing protein [Calothrix sp. MO_192.B10]